MLNPQRTRFFQVLLMHCAIFIGFCSWNFRLSYSLTQSVSLQEYYTTATDVSIAIQSGMLKELQKHLSIPKAKSVQNVIY